MSRRSRTALLVALSLVTLTAILLGAGTATGVIGGSDPVDSPSEAQKRESRIAVAINFRKQFGLRSDPEYVAQLDDQRDRYERAIGRWGVPLSDEELEDLERREDVSEETKSVIRAYVIEAAADSFAGVWIDQRAGGVIRVGFTEDADRHLIELRKLSPYPAWIEVFEARYTEAELEDLADRVSRDMRELGLSEVGVDIEANAVAVGAPELTEELERELDERYPGEPLRLEERPQLQTR